MSPTALVSLKRPGAAILPPMHLTDWNGPKDEANEGMMIRPRREAVLF
jgi:hypothetical protein